MSWLLFDNTVAGRTACRRFAAACDILLGWPRTHSTQYNARTETQCRIVRHNSTQQMAVEIDSNVRSVAGRAANVTDGTLVQVTVALTGADRTEMARLTGWPTLASNTNPWLDRPARDGIVV